MVTWGLDLLECGLEVKLDKPIEQMSLAEVRGALHQCDRILSAAEEETDLDFTYARGKLVNPREQEAKRARELKKTINSEGSAYHQLIERFSQLAASNLDKRAVGLRERHATYERFASDPEIDALKKKALKAWQERTLTVESLGVVTLDRVSSILQSHPDTSVRESLYRAAREVDDIETLVHTEIRKLNELVRGGSAYNNFFEVRAAYCEVNPASLQVMLRDFVAGTKPIYDRLFRELVTDEKVSLWDIGYLIVQKDPFRQLPVPQDPSQLLAIGLSLLKEIGYDPELVDRLYQRRDGVYLDIEDRDGKGAGAFTCSLGPFSQGKNILFYQPRSFESDAWKRWTTFPHELGHGVHHEKSRDASVRHGAAFFQENTVGSEVVSKFHDALPLEAAFLARHFPGVDARNLVRWKLFNDLHTLYGAIGVALGDILMHTHGTAGARQCFHDGYEFVKPEKADTSLGPSASYVRTHHVFTQPAYMFAYPLADLYRLALLQAARDTNGSLISPKTAPFLMEKIMTGNVKPMHQRVVEATGKTDFVQSAVQYFHDAVK